MKEKIGYAIGVFDLFHIGHLNLLNNAKIHCDKLIAGVSTDELAFKIKKKKPIIPFEERIEIVKNIACVDEVVPVDNTDKLEAWKRLNFNIIFKGDDWKNTEEWNTLEKTFIEMGVEVIYLPYTKHTSSTLIREILDTIYSERLQENGVTDKDLDEK